MKSVGVSVLTNIAYGLIGFGMIIYNDRLLAPAIACFILMLGSGIHHYYRTSFTLNIDYYGMYAVLLSVILMGSGAGFAHTLFISLGLALALLLVSEPSQLILGIMIAFLFSLLIVKAGMHQAMAAATFACIAFVFNHIGDNLHRKDHSLIHGLGWHVPTAFAILIAAKSLV